MHADRRAHHRHRTGRCPKIVQRRAIMFFGIFAVNNNFFISFEIIPSICQYFLCNRKRELADKEIPQGFTWNVWQNLVAHDDGIVEARQLAGLVKCCNVDLVQIQAELAAHGAQPYPRVRVLGGESDVCFAREASRNSEQIALPATRDKVEWSIEQQPRLPRLMLQGLRWLWDDPSDNRILVF